MYISVKTAPKHYDRRLSILKKTWFQKVNKEEVYSLHTLIKMKGGWVLNSLAFNSILGHSKMINFLFPVHRPHLVTVSSKYSIIFRLFLHTDKLSKNIVSSRVSSAIMSAQTSRLCYFLQLENEGTCFCAAFYSCARQILA